MGYVGHSEGTTQMFLAGSLPQTKDFVKRNINLAVMVGPVACTANIPSKPIRFAASKIKEIQFLMLHVLKCFNWWGPMPVAVEALDTFCHFFGGVCKSVAGILHHDGVDNPERFATFMSNLPSGASYRTFVYYAQQINSGKMQLYDYGRVGNKKKYGTNEPPMVALKENYGVPTALLSGDMDHLADPVDVANTAADL